MAEGSHRGREIHWPRVHTEAKKTDGRGFTLRSESPVGLGDLDTCSVAAASAGFSHWVPVSRWMELDTFSYCAVSSLVLSKPRPRAEGGVGVWNGIRTS